MGNYKNTYEFYSSVIKNVIISQIIVISDIYICIYNIRLNNKRILNDEG